MDVGKNIYATNERDRVLANNPPIHRIIIPRPVVVKPRFRIIFPASELVTVPEVRRLLRIAEAVIAVALYHCLVCVGNSGDALCASRS